MYVSSKMARTRLTHTYPKTYIPKNDTYIPQNDTYIHQNGTYIPQTDTYIPKKHMKKQIEKKPTTKGQRTHHSRNRDMMQQTGKKNRDIMEQKK